MIFQGKRKVSYLEWADPSRQLDCGRYFTTGVPFKHPSLVCVYMQAISAVVHVEFGKDAGFMSLCSGSFPLYLFLAPDLLSKYSWHGSVVLEGFNGNLPYSNPVLFWLGQGLLPHQAIEAGSYALSGQGGSGGRCSDGGWLPLLAPSVCVCPSVFVFSCLTFFLYLDVYIYIHIHTHIHIYIYIHMHIHTCISVCVVDVRFARLCIR